LDTVSTLAASRRFFLLQQSQTAKMIGASQIREEAAYAGVMVGLGASVVSLLALYLAGFTMSPMMFVTNLGVVGAYNYYVFTRVIQNPSSM
jgi:hypothetical protein